MEKDVFESILEKTLSLSRRLKFLIRLLEIDIKKNESLVFSEIEKRILNIENGDRYNSQPDLRRLLNDLANKNILILKKEDRYKNKEYGVDNKKLVKLIYDSSLCECMKNIIHMENKIAIT